MKNNNCILLYKVLIQNRNKVLYRILKNNNKRKVNKFE